MEIEWLGICTVQVQLQPLKPYDENIKKIFGTIQAMEGLKSKERWMKLFEDFMC